MARQNANVRLQVSASATVSSKLINAAIVRGPAGLLKAEGFRKKGRLFYRHSSEVTTHVWFQASRWNNPGRASFTVNLSTYLPAIAEAKGEDPILEPTKVRPPHAGLRIGHLMPEQTDYWWNITSPREVESVAQQVTVALREYGLPYLARVETLEGVAELSGCIPGIIDDPTEPKAVALKLLGRTAEAARIQEQLRLRAERFRSQRNNATEA
jgi:uncharacterized protein DUF4304